jgi:hypothetical protein
LNGLSPECLLLWSVKCPWVVKVLLQPATEQTKGFSPEWILSWVFKLPFSVKSLSQPLKLHLNGFSPVYELSLWINWKLHEFCCEFSNDQTLSNFCHRLCK